MGMQTGAASTDGYEQLSAEEEERRKGAKEEQDELTAIRSMNPWCPEYLLKPSLQVREPLSPKSRWVHPCHYFSCITCLCCAHTLLIHSTASTVLQEWQNRDRERVMLPVVDEWCVASHTLAHSSLPYTLSHAHSSHTHPLSYTPSHTHPLSYTLLSYTLSCTPSHTHSSLYATPH
jgi:hypothetical protein